LDDSNRMVTVPKWAGFGEFPPDLEAIVGTEVTDYGWRGITSDGEIIEVRSKSGDRPTVPESIMVRDAASDRLLGRREIRGEVIDITAYLDHFARSVVCHKACDNEAALEHSDAAIAIAPTLRARFNRAMVLLSLGRWGEGFDEFEKCERSPPFLRPIAKAALDRGIEPWRGGSLEGKRLLVIHDHGLGDTLMALRYVPDLVAMGADVKLVVPIELARIAAQFAPVLPGLVSADYFVSFLHLLRWLEIVPTRSSGGYVRVDPLLAAEWRDRLGEGNRPRIGVAWSVGKFHDGDFPRALLLEEVIRICGDPDIEVEYHSVQVQGRNEAEALGVRAYDFFDLADCAALMSNLDEIVSIDTAAIHLAGAIGHPDAMLLLSKWHSWRWNGNPFYPDVRIREI
jgi:hypothetical protein